jgi:hypothetical protein
MIRGDNIICGTTTTGTGTLTLAATPGPPGGVDFDVFARATGIGFGNSAAVLVSYTIIEYTDNTFATAKATEKGIGTLTLGGSAGIANATLARTTLQSTATSLNSQPATQNIAPATAYSIVTAANTLVFIGPSVADTLAAVDPYFETVSGSVQGIGPLCTSKSQNLTTCNAIAVSGTDYYAPFYWPTTMLVKKIWTYVQTAYTGGTSNVYGRIYAVGTGGRPGKLMIDFGALGTAGSGLASTGTIHSAASANGYFLTPGAYIMDWLGIFTAGSGTPQLMGSDQLMVPYFFGADGGAIASNGQGPVYAATATGGNATAPDQANTTGYGLSSLGGNAILPTFSLTPS